MNSIHKVLLLLTAFLAVFAQATLDGPRRLLGAQLDFLTPLMVLAAFSESPVAITVLALVGGLSLDALSANPLGVSILPLFLPAFAIHHQRALILRDQHFAQSVLGAGACAGTAVCSLLLLMTLGRLPALGWGTLWVLCVVTLGGAMLGPIYFALFDWLQRSFFYQTPKSTSFDPDRQIKRDRHLS